METRQRDFGDRVIEQFDQALRTVFGEPVHEMSRFDGMGIETYLRRYLEQVRDNLEAAGLDDAVVQTFGLDTEIVVRIPPRSEEESSADLSTLVLQALQRDYAGTIDMRRVEFVGPQVGEELTEQGILAVVYALIGIFLYVMMRFQWRFSVGAVTALVHDVIITMGIISARRQGIEKKFLTPLKAAKRFLARLDSETFTAFTRSGVLPGVIWALGYAA